MKNIIFIMLALGPIFAGAQIKFVQKGGTLTLDSTNANVTHGCMFDVIADTAWAESSLVVKVDGYTINGADSVILDGGAKGSVLHLWITLGDSLSTDVKSNLHMEPYWASEVSSGTTAKKWSWTPVNSASLARTVRAPANAAVGDWFGVFDSRGTAASNNITIDFTSDSYRLNGSVQNSIISTANGYAMFRFFGGAIGWAKIN